MSSFLACYAMYAGDGSGACYPALYSSLGMVIVRIPVDLHKGFSNLLQEKVHTKSAYFICSSVSKSRMSGYLLIKSVSKFCTFGYLFIKSMKYPTPVRHHIRHPRPTMVVAGS